MFSGFKPLKNSSKNKYFFRNWKIGRRAARQNILQKRELRANLTNVPGVTWKRESCLRKQTLQMTSRSFCLNYLHFYRLIP